jgi:hypothetical protein
MNSDNNVRDLPPPLEEQPNQPPTATGFRTIKNQKSKIKIGYSPCFPDH